MSTILLDALEARAHRKRVLAYSSNLSLTVASGAVSLKLKDSKERPGKDSTEILGRVSFSVSTPSLVVLMPMMFGRGAEMIGADEGPMIERDVVGHNRLCRNVERIGF